MVDASFLSFTFCVDEIIPPSLLSPQVFFLRSGFLVLIFSRRVQIMFSVFILLLRGYFLTPLLFCRSQSYVFHVLFEWESTPRLAGC